MAFAVALSESWSVPVDDLVRAFEASPSLVAGDARARAGHHGLIVDGLSQEDAEAVAEALRHRGHDAHAVPGSELTVPRHRVIRRAVVEPGGLRVFDHRGRGTLHARSEIAGVHAGILSRERLRVAGTHTDAEGGMHVDHELVGDEKLVCDVIVGEQLRYRIESDGFDYSFVWGTEGLTMASKLVALLEQLADGTPTSDSARSLIERRRAARFSSERAFEREARWLVWRWRRRPQAERRRPPSPATTAGYRDAPPGARKPDVQLDDDLPDRLYASQKSRLDRHLERRRNLDVALAVLGGVLASGWAFFELGIGSTFGKVATLVVVTAVVTPVAYSSLRRWRRRRFWTG